MLRISESLAKAHYIEKLNGFWSHLEHRTALVTSQTRILTYVDSKFSNKLLNGVQNTKGQLFKRTLARVQQNCVVIHFQFAQRVHLNTIYCEQF